MRASTFIQPLVMSGALAYAACASTAVTRHDVPFYVNEKGSCAVREEGDRKKYICDVDGDTLADVVQMVVYRSGTKEGIGGVTFVLDEEGQISTVEFLTMAWDGDCESGTYKVHLNPRDQQGCQLPEEFRSGFQPEVDNLLRYFHSTGPSQRQIPRAGVKNG